MRKPQNTPGPWRIMENRTGDERETYIGVTVSKFPRSDKHVCRVSSWGGDMDNCPEMRANARLIAAAPALVEALRGLLDDVNQPNVESRYPAVIAARSALREAGYEGGER